MEFFNDYLMYQLFFGDAKVTPRGRRRWSPPATASGTGATASNSGYASRRESMVDLSTRRASGVPLMSTTWRQSSWDVSQQLRLPMRQRLVRKRSGSWSGPPSGSSSHHLLAIEEEDRPPERRWASLDNNTPTIQVTQADKDEVRQQQSLPLEQKPLSPKPQLQQQKSADESTAELEISSIPKSPNPNYSLLSTAGLSAMLRIKQKLARKRSGSLPEERLALSELDRNRLAPPGHLSADATVSQTPAATSPTSPSSAKFVRGRSTGSLPGPGTLSPRLLLSGQSPTLTLSPIASPACSPMPTPCTTKAPVEFPETLAVGKGALERRQTVADTGARQARKSQPSTPPSISSLLNLYLDPANKFARQNEFEKASDEEDDVVLNLGYSCMDKKKQQKRRATCVGAFQAEAATNEPNNPPIADLIHFSSSPSDDEKEAAMGEENEWMDERGEEDRFGGWERGQTDRHEATLIQTNAARKESSSREYKDVFQKIIGRRPLAPCFAAMASKFRKNMTHRDWPNRGETLPEMPEASSGDELQEESWLRKTSVPLPPRRDFKRMLQHQRPCASQEVAKEDFEQAAAVRRLSQSRKSQSARGQADTEEEEEEEAPMRKHSGLLPAPIVAQPVTICKPPAVDAVTTISVQQKLQPFLLHSRQLQHITVSHLVQPIVIDSADKKGTEIPSICLKPEMPGRSKSNVADTSKPAKMNMDKRRNMSTCGERPDLADREAGLLEQALMKSTKPMAMAVQQGEISISLHYSQSIGFLTVMLNKTKNMPYTRDTFIKILRFESDCLVECTQTPIVRGKSNPEFKQGYMFGMEESKLLITHLVIELWECDVIGEQKRSGYVVIGPHAGGSGCLQWTRVVKHPNFPCSVWHQLAQCEN